MNLGERFMHTVTFMQRAHRPSLVWTLLAALAFAAQLPAAGIGVGDLAPDVQFLDAEGENHSLSEFRGRWVFLNVWSNRSRLAKQEIPQFQEAFAEHASDRFVAIGISIDGKREAWEKAIADLGVTYPQFHVSGEMRKALVDALALKSSFSTWGIDPEGRVTLQSIRGSAAQHTFKILAKNDTSEIDVLKKENLVWNEILERLQARAKRKGSPEELRTSLLNYVKEYPEGPNITVVQRSFFSMNLDVDGSPLKTIAHGEEVPDFRYLDAKGDAHNLRDHRGSWLLLSIWGSEANKYMLTELKDLNPVYEEYKDDGATVLGLSVDWDAKAWTSKVDELDLSFPQGRADRQNALRVQAQYETRRMPAVHLIDPEGKLVVRNVTPIYFGPYLKKATQAEKEERDRFFAQIHREEVRNKEFKRVLATRTGLQMGKIEREVFVKLAEAFIQEYPATSQAEEVADLLKEE